MLTAEQIDSRNSRLMAGLGRFLNQAPDFIAAAEVDQLVADCGVSRELAYSLLLAAALGLDTAESAEDRELFDQYFPAMLHRLDAERYRRNPYYARVAIPEATVGNWELKRLSYQPYEAFVCNDLERLPDGRVVPQIGYFESEFPYPAVLEDGREWMLVTPNEIETMQPAVERASGRVLTYGLGLGYFAFMASEKPEVSTVTVVEKDENVIRLFESHLLPQLEHSEKVRIVHHDAFEHAAKQLAAGGFDFVFSDLWHDPSDGVELYLKMKGFERLSPKSVFMYWIEKTLLHYV